LYYPGTDPFKKPNKTAKQVRGTAVGGRKKSRDFYIKLFVE